MNIGYACLTEGVKDTDFKSCILKNASEDRLKAIIKHNLNSLENILDYNYKNNIKLFRITSDLIPFASRQGLYTFDWGDYFLEDFKRLNQKIKKYNIRVSMHPGQYTVINSPREEVVENSIRDLEYHCRLMNLLTDDISHKMILHIGGVYGEKDRAKDRFVENYKLLSPDIKDRLVIENDDKSYTVEDVLEISQRTGSPVVFDNLHNDINKSKRDLDDREWILLCNKTWKKEDGVQKIHYSEQGENKKIGSHSDTIDLDIFLDYYQKLEDLDIDIMLEVKDKNISAIKCINSTRKDRNIKYLEWEWARYKYSVLDKSHKDYLYIRELLKDKEDYPVEEFYKTVLSAISKDIKASEYENGLLHVWGYLKDLVTDAEKNRFMNILSKLKNDEVGIERVKRNLENLSKKYNIDFLLNSYYFHI